MTLVQEIEKLFDENFPKQIEGRPRQVSEWGGVYHTFAFGILRLGADYEPYSGPPSSVERCAFAAATGEWIKLLRERDPANDILVWRIRPTFEEEAATETTAHRMKIRLRVHTLSQDAYDKGPILKPDEAMTASQAEHVARFQQQLRSQSNEPVENPLD